MYFKNISILIVFFILIQFESFGQKSIYSSEFKDLAGDAHKIEVLFTLDGDSNFEIRITKADSELIKALLPSLLSEKEFEEAVLLGLTNLNFELDYRTDFFDKTQSLLKKAYQTANSLNIYVELLGQDTITFLGKGHYITSYLISDGSIIKQPYDLKVLYSSEDKPSPKTANISPSLVDFMKNINDQLPTKVDKQSGWRLYEEISSLFQAYKVKSKVLRDIHWGSKQFDLISLNKWDNFLIDLIKIKNNGTYNYRIFLTNLDFSSSYLDEETQSISVIAKEAFELRFKELVPKLYDTPLNKKPFDQLIQELITVETKKLAELQEKERKLKEQDEQLRLVHESTFFFNGGAYKLSAKKPLIADVKKYEFTLSKDGVKEKFRLGNLEQPEVFNRFVELAVSKILDRSLSSSESSALRNATLNFLIRLVGKENFASSSEPTAAHLVVRRGLFSYQIPSKKAYDREIKKKKQVAKADLEAVQKQLTEVYVQLSDTNAKNRKELKAVRDSLILAVSRANKIWLDFNNASYRNLRKEKRISRTGGTGCSEAGGFCRKVQVDSVEIEFFEGSIKKMLVMASVLEDGGSVDKAYQNVIYYNTRPIAISSFRNVEKLKKIDLRAFTNYDKNKDNVFLINLADLFVYKPSLSLYSEDYSPKNQVIVVRPNEPGSVRLTKDNAVEILKARVFSDFIGLNEETPNGLIQTEATQKFVLNPSRYTDPRKGETLRGLLNFIEPNITVSKFEQENRSVPLKMVVTDTVISSISEDLQDTLRKPVFSGATTTLELLRRAKFNIGTKLNVALVDIPEFKSSLYFNIGANYYLVSVEDSTDFKNNPERSGIPINTRNITMFGKYCEFIWDLKPHPQIGLNFGYQIMRLRSNTGFFKQVTNVSEIDVSSLADLKALEEARLLSKIHLSFTVRPSRNKSDKSELFFRAAYFSSQKDRTQNFLQIQGGYSFYLFK